MNKRGLLVGVLLGILLLTTFSFAEETKPTTNAAKAKELKVHGVDNAIDQIYSSFVIACDNCNEGTTGCEKQELRCNQENEISNDLNRDVECRFQKKNEKITFFSEDDGECSKDVSKSPYNKPATSGCWIFLSESDDGLDDDCGYVLAREGSYFTETENVKLNFNTKRTWVFSETEESPNDVGCMTNQDSWRIDSNSYYLCSDDHYWHSCTGSKDQEKGDLNSVTWANNHLFSCTKNKETNDNPVWKDLGQDKDHDFYAFDATDPKKKDCADDPKDDLPICKETSDVDNPLTLCDDPDKKYSTCSYCRNPGAKEIAGDKVDNDCIGGDVADPDDNEKACTDKNLNLAGESYYWMGSDVKDNGKNAGCCGDDPTDFGKIFTTKAGDVLCLENDKNKVGTFEGGVEATINAFMKGDKNNPLPCSVDHWCAPLMTSLPFHIFTIKQPGQSAYDVVSNGYSWEECKEGKEGPLPKPPITTEPAAVNGFYCYKEGDHWSWVNCKPQAENEQKTLVKNGIKDRVEGDGLCV